MVGPVPGRVPPGHATILHADLDAFYASVEQLLDPSLKRRPIAVGGGVVLAASYEARALGVRGGMSGWRARQLCPSLRFVGGHFDDYRRLGDRFVDVLREFTPLVERVSIDEAFLDVAGSTHLFGAPGEIAVEIRKRVREETGLAVSVGAARTKHLAKVASQVAKPDGLVVVEPAAEGSFLRHLPVSLLWGVGPVTSERLAGSGIRTIGELAATPSRLLEQLLGHAVGEKLACLATNRDPRRVGLARRAASVGAQAALGRRRATDALLSSTLGYLSDRIAGRLRSHRLAGHTVTVAVRFPGMRSVSRSITVSAPVSATRTLTEIATGLVGIALSDNPQETDVTLLAVSVSGLVDEPVLQLELPFGFDDANCRPGSVVAAARWGADRAMDKVRARFGRDAVGYATTLLSDAARTVPEAFRELAERSAGERV
jgi:DNA polymerase IV